ncbi:MAG: histone deacetylase family protein [Solirubrobacteraceae bacterium]
MTAAPVFLDHPASLAHETGAHPERPARMVAISQELERRGWLGYARRQSPEVARSDLLAVHPERQIELIERAADRGGAQIDADTVVSPGSFQAAAHAAGGAVALVDLLLDGAAPTGFSAHRPPGHHAERDRAMGFCLFNSIAVAARHAVAERGCERVMIVDWDVHHGNGTNNVFHADPQVLFLSIHQSPLYPGTGPASDVGSGAGRGFTVNLPVAPGSGDDVFAALVDHVAVPLAREFAPQLLLISAGFDAHAEDPLADCQVTEAGFSTMARSLADVAAELEVPVGAVLEGGYALDALGRSVAATMETLAAPPRAAAPTPAGRSDQARAARARLAQWWPGLSGG